MNREELLEMLDLAGKEAAPVAEAVILTRRRAETPTSAKPASPTALQLDDWALRRGRDLLEGERTAARAASGRARRGGLPRLRLRARPAARRATAWTPGAGSSSRRCWRRPTTRRCTRPRCSTRPLRRWPPSPSPSSSPPSNEEEEEGERPVEAEMATLRAVGKALTKATEEVEEMREAAAALGLGPGSPGGNDPAAIAALFKRVRCRPAPCGGSASWPGASAAWRSPGSGGRRSTATTTWWA